MTGTVPPDHITPRIVGLCTGRKDIDWFARDNDSIAAAQAVCAVCPSTLPCYAAAAANDERFGVWGGVNFGSPTRTRGVPRRQPAMCGEPSGYKAHRARGETACPECKAAHVARNSHNRTLKRQQQQGSQ